MPRDVALTGAGDAVRVAFTKWGGRAHWEYDAELLGEDRHGTWVGTRAGALLTRPGVALTAPLPFVTLLPRDRPFIARFYDHRDAGSDAPDRGGAAGRLAGDGAASARAAWSMVEVYVDITTVPVWSGRTVTCVDLDLDVVRGRSGRVWVEDEDEFAAHRLRYRYPAHLVRTASASCRAALAEVTARSGPYDGRCGPAWVSRLASRTVGV